MIEPGRDQAAHWDAGRAAGTDPRTRHVTLDQTDRGGHRGVMGIDDGPLQVGIR